MVEKAIRKENKEQGTVPIRKGLVSESETEDIKKDLEKTDNPMEKLHKLIDAGAL